MEKLLLRAGTEGEREREGVVYVEGLEILEDRGGDPSRETIHGKTIILYW